MSVELYAYPQDFDQSSMVAVDYLFDGLLFATLDTSTLYLNPSVTMQTGLNYYAATLPYANWDRYALNNTTKPQENSNELYLQAGGGIFQKLQGLTIGQAYKISFIVGAIQNPAATILLGFFDGVNNFDYHTTNALATAGATVEYTFVPTTSTPIIGIQGDLHDCLTLTWKVQNVIANTLSDGQVLIDLFQHQSIPLTLSVDNFQNAAEKTQSYSKAFKLPGTSRNNLIFNSVFDVTSTTNTASTFYNFNPYKKTPIVLQENGETIFTGFLRMLDINFEGIEESVIYNVNLYSETVSLKEVLKGKKLYDLDLTELDHVYNKTNIKNSWNSGAGQGLVVYQDFGADSFAGTSGTDITQVLKYPFVDWTHQALVGTGTGNNAAVGMPEFTSLSQMFRPWIKLDYILNRIFEAAEYTWTSSFLSSSDFNNLFMDFNWGAEGGPVVGSATAYARWRDFGQPNTYPTYSYAAVPIFTWQEVFLPDSEVLPNYSLVDQKYISVSNFNLVEFDTYMEVENTTATARSISIRIQCRGGIDPADRVSQTFSIAANATNQMCTLNAQFVLQAGETMEYLWAYTTGSTPPNSIRLYNNFTTASVTNLMTSNVYNFTSADMLQNLRGKLGQWEFVKGILTMFNLVTLADPDNSSNIQIERYDDVFPKIGVGGGNLNSAARGIKLDWTDKVDITKVKLKPLTKLKQFTNFEYKEDGKDYIYTNYKNAFGGFKYGSLIFDASYFNLLSGEQTVSATPFAATLNKNYAGVTPFLWAPSIYSLEDDGSTKEFANKPRICYDNGKVTMADGTFYIPAQFGTSENANTFLQFSGFSDVPILNSSFDLNFGTCQVIGQNNNTVKNLYNEHFANYYGQLYNSDTRIMTLKVKLNASDINQFSFSDIVMIKNRAYRVNKINYSPNTLAKVEFILIP